VCPQQQFHLLFWDHISQIPTSTALLVSDTTPNMEDVLVSFKAQSFYFTL
jgi:hypothetical protein